MLAGLTQQRLSLTQSLVETACLHKGLKLFELVR